MIEAIIENEKFRRYFPPAAAAGIFMVFVSLGLWQLDRAAEKNALNALFAGDATYAPLTADTPLTDFRNIETFGSYDGERQVLIDNMFLEGRVGYYVITPLLPAAGPPWIIVNRGWIPKPRAGEPDPDIGVGDADRRVRGRVGHLPKVGIRSGAAFAGGDTWPKKGLYPSLAELSSELDREFLPVALLLSPDDEGGYVRNWQPAGSGPAMHYGYSAQWFAMAAAVLGFLVWRLRKLRKQGGG